MRGNREKYLEAHLDIITYFSKSIFRRNTIEDILWDITANCIRRLDFVDCVVYMVNPTKTGLIQKAAYGAKDIEGVKVASPIEIPMGDGIVGTVAQTGKPELIVDCSADPRYIVDDEVRNSEICVPIIFEDEVIGVIDSEHPEKGFYTEEHIHILASIATISANKIARTLVEQENEVLARFVGENPNPVLRIDGHGRILNHNRASEGLFDYWKVHDGTITDRETLFQVNAVLERGKTETMEISHQNKELSLSIVPIKEHAYANIYVSDITELKHAKQIAEKASQAKDEFLSIMSHEMRTPLNAILGVSSLMRSEADIATKERLLNTLDFSGKNLLALINDVLDLAKIESGKISFEEITFNPASVIEELKQSFEHRAEERGNTLQLCIDDIPQFVSGDENRLIQVMTNLISNAIKFTENGTVTIGVSEIKGKTDFHTLQFDVQDTGIGIEDSQHDHVFNAFEQANTSTTREYGGTGLGLSITKKLVTLQGGEVILQSEPGVGSTFSVILTFAKGKASHAEKSQAHLLSESQELEGRTVLIVDDNPINLLVAEEIIKKWGVVIVKATDGQSAYQKYCETDADIILMDLQMPLCDGIEATKMIRNLVGAESEVPIIAVTADAMEKTREEALNAGMNDIITKPFNPTDLLAKMKTGLGLN